MLYFGDDCMNQLMKVTPPPSKVLIMFYWPPEKHFPAINESKVTLKHSFTTGYEIHLNKFHIKNTLYQAELKLVKWFLRRRFKCEMFMSMLMSPTDKEGVAHTMFNFPKGVAWKIGEVKLYSYVEKTLKTYVFIPYF